VISRGKCFIPYTQNEKIAEEEGSGEIEETETRKSCCYDLCENSDFSYNDEVILFTFCDHTFHRFCLEKAYDELKQQELNKYNLLMLEDILDDDYLENFQIQIEGNNDVKKSSQEGGCNKKLVDLGYECLICKYNN